MDAVEARSWITRDVAKKLFADCGQDFDALKKSAVTKGFRPVTLKATATIEIKQQIRSFKSHNVIGKLEGGDPKLRDEYIIYTAHWDHLGRHPELQGDQIFNGAIDNASGVASVLQLAAAFTKLNPPTKGRFCSWPRPLRRLDCSAQSITQTIRFIRWRKRWPTSTSTESILGEKRTTSKTLRMVIQSSTTC